MRYGFSEEVRQAAGRLAAPVQRGSFAWTVPSMSQPGRVRYVHTDARFPASGKVQLSFADCSCPAGKHQDTAAGSCSHIFRVFQEIYRRTVEE